MLSSPDWNFDATNGPKPLRRRVHQTPEVWASQDVGGIAPSKALTATTRRRQRTAGRGDRFAWNHMASQSGCIWYRCPSVGKPYVVRGLFFRTVRVYCDYHAHIAAIDGFRVAPFQREKGHE